MATIKDLTDSTLLREISNGISVVDFWAEWCMPCKKLHPIMQSIAEKFDGKVKFFKLNVDNNPNMTNKFGVMGLPTLVVFDSGDVMFSMSGFHTEEKISKKIMEFEFDD